MTRERGKKKEERNLIQKPSPSKVPAEIIHILVALSPFVTIERLRTQRAQLVHLLPLLKCSTSRVEKTETFWFACPNRGLILVSFKLYCGLEHSRRELGVFGGLTSKLAWEKRWVLGAGCELHVKWGAVLEQFRNHIIV